MDAKLYKAIFSLLNDIEAMQMGQTDTFGGFNEWHIDGDQANIEWTNLAISSAELRELMEGTVIEGQLAAPQLPTKVYFHSQDRCPSNHWNDGTDVCEDCGKDLHE